ncbi:MAG: hypothetical protein ACKO1R_06540 [Crocinitomicaceae bacterium]
MVNCFNFALYFQAMGESKKIKTALISVYYKTGLDELVKELHANGVEMYSTGGTQKFIEELQLPVTPVEALTQFPEILGGRVKTLHPKIFGGILNRRNLNEDQIAIETHDIPQIKKSANKALVIMDEGELRRSVKSNCDAVAYGYVDGHWVVAA